VVCTLGALFAPAETRSVHICEELTMRTTVDEQRARNRTTDRRADLAEDLAFVVMLFSGIVMAVAIVVAAFVI
jgi:hypothetical protein